MNPPGGGPPHLPYMGAPGIPSFVPSPGMPPLPFVLPQGLQPPPPPPGMPVMPILQPAFPVQMMGGMPPPSQYEVYQRAMWEQQQQAQMAAMAAAAPWTAPPVVLEAAPPPPPPPIAAQMVGEQANDVYVESHSGGAKASSTARRRHAPASTSGKPKSLLRLEPVQRIPATKAFPTRASSTRPYHRYGRVGAGTYGVVHKAALVHGDERDEIPVAIKSIRGGKESRDGLPLAAVREIKVLQSIDHTNIIKLIDVLTENDEVFLALEYMEHDLSGLLCQTDVAIEVPHFKCYMHQLLCALQALHDRGIVHRDVKASNVLINNGGVLKLADFGLARFYQDSWIGSRPSVFTNRVVTLAYRPPELLLGATDYGPEVDMWSAGCVLYELYSKTQLFRGEDEVDQLYQIFQKCGSIDEAAWPGAIKLPWYHLVKPKAPFPSTLNKSLVELNMSAAAIELTESLLEMPPKKRPTAAQALQHAYFVTDEPLPAPLEEMPRFPREWRQLDAKVLRKNRPADGAAASGTLPGGGAQSNQDGGSSASERSARTDPDNS